MAWDFEIEPEFQEKLDRIERLIGDEVEPLTQLGLGYAGPNSRAYQKAVRPLRARVKEQGLRAEWAARAQSIGAL